MKYSNIIPILDSLIQMFSNNNPTWNLSIFSCERHWYYVVRVWTSSFSRHFLKLCLVKPKRGNLEVYIVYIYIYICAWLSLAVEVLESRPFSSIFVRLALVVFWPSASLPDYCPHRVPSTILLSLKQCDPLSLRRSQRSCSTLNLPVPTDFCFFGFFEDENGKEVFLWVFVLT